MKGFEVFAIEHELLVLGPGILNRLEELDDILKLGRELFNGLQRLGGGGGSRDGE